MILEEFKQPDAVLFHDLLNLDHEGIMITFSIEISKSVTECRLGTCCVTVDHVFKAVCISKKISISDRIVFIAVNEGNSVYLVLIDLEAERVQYLSKYLRAHLEMA